MMPSEKRDKPEDLYDAGKTFNPDQQTITQKNGFELYISMFFVFAAIALMNAIYIGVYTIVGAGPSVYSFAADDKKAKLAIVAAALTLLWIMALFVFDWHLLTGNIFKEILQFTLGLILFVLMIMAATLRAVFYPYASAFVCLVVVLLMLSGIRITVFPQMGKGGSQFYRIASAQFFLCAVIVTIVSLAWFAGNDKWWNEDTKYWLAAKNDDVYKFLSESLDNVRLSYAYHCRDQSNLQSLYPKDTATAIVKKCKIAKTVWFLQWSGPFIVIVADIVFAALCALVGYDSLFEQSRQRTSPASEDEAQGTAYGSSEGDDARARVKRRVLIFCKRGIFIFSMSIGLIYASLYVSGAAVNLGSALLCLGALSATVISIVMYHELSEVLVAAIGEQSFSKYVVEAMKSEWLRAFMVGAINIFIPLLALLDIARQRVRRCRGCDDPDPANMFTIQGRKVVSDLKEWNWVGIFKKVILLVELFVLLIVGSKFTFVFFSWLNEKLAAADLNFGVLSTLVFLLGFLMFMCPIVPGSAVYLFAGVVLGAQAQLDSGPGFMAGAVIGCIVGTFAKLSACTGQYGLGLAAGSRVKVQQFVGVDKVPTRAMEKVLKHPGVKVGKISLLVAGPDFPVSMLCGILKLNVPAMLCGTLPVILVSIIPQTLVGALLTKDGGDSGIWSMISTGVTAFAAVFQAIATFVYIFSIMKTIERDGEELAKPRPEHQAVADLTAKEESYVQAYAYVTKWTLLDFRFKALIFLSVAFFLLAGAIMCADFVMSEKYCFRTFAITNKIGDSYENDGLENNALNLVMPAGWASLAFAVIGVILNYAFGKFVAAVARDHERVSSQSDGSVEKGAGKDDVTTLNG